MSLLALLAALLAQRVRPPSSPQPLLALYGRMCLSVAKRLNAGDRNSGGLAWLALVAAILVPVALASFLAASVHASLLWMLEVAFLYATVRFFTTTGALRAIEQALREGDASAAARHLGLWRAEPIDATDSATIARVAAEHGLREAHQGTFAPLFWYLLLPGPLGLVLYPLALRAARTWEIVVEPEEREFGWFAARAFHVIDWVPQRVSAFVFAIAGNFEDAVLGARAAAQAARADGVAVAAGAGALGVRLEESGAGEAPREDTLASLEGMLWRVLAVWAIVLLLVAALPLG